MSLEKEPGILDARLHLASDLEQVKKELLHWPQFLQLQNGDDITYLPHSGMAGDGEALRF